MRRIGMLGLTHPHAGAYMSSVLRHAELIAVWDEGQPALAGQWSLEQACTPCQSINDFLNTSMDAVVIASAHEEQYEYLKALDGTGIPVLCESPMTAGRGLRLYASRPVRYAPALQEARRRLQSKDCGQAISVMISAGYGSYRQSGQGCIDDALDAAACVLQQELVLLSAEMSSVDPDGMGTGCLLLKSHEGTAIGVDIKRKPLANHLLEEEWKIDIVTEREWLQLDLFAQGGIVTDMSSGAIRTAYWGDSPFDGVVNEFIRSLAAAC